MSRLLSWWTQNKTKENAIRTISTKLVDYFFKIKDKFKETLDNLVSSGIIEPVEDPVDWVNNVVLVEKQNGSFWASV